MYSFISTVITKKQTDKLKKKKMETEKAKILHEIDYIKNQRKIYRSFCQSEITRNWRKKLEFVNLHEKSKLNIQEALQYLKDEIKWNVTKWINRLAILQEHERRIIRFQSKPNTLRPSELAGVYRLNQELQKNQFAPLSETENFEIKKEIDVFRTIIEYTPAKPKTKNPSKEDPIDLLEGMGTNQIINLLFHTRCLIEKEIETSDMIKRKEKQKWKRCKTKCKDLLEQNQKILEQKIKNYKENKLNLNHKMSSNDTILDILQSIKEQISHCYNTEWLSNVKEQLKEAQHNHTWTNMLWNRDIMTANKPRLTFQEIKIVLRN